MPGASDPADSPVIDAEQGARPDVKSEALPGTEATDGAGRGPSLVRNTFYLTAAQAVTIPLSILSNALIGRYLGSEQFGFLYLATTLCSFGVLALEWGQQGAVPALVARNREGAASYLGTSLAWRTGSSLLVSLLLALLCVALGYETGVRWAVALAFPLAVLNSFNAGFKDTIRGFERTDIPALAHVAQQLMMVLIVVPVLLLGGQLRALLLSHIAVAFLTMVYLRRSLGAVGITKLRFDRSFLKPLLRQGTPFVFFDIAMVLGPNINASFLAKLAPAEVIGWFHVSQKLIGLLLFPATALVGALYPTLCRLHGQDQEGFARVTRGALYGVSLVAIPAAVGCGAFAEIGVAIYGAGEFAGAVPHLRVMSLFVLLVYFSMPLGISIIASARQKTWTLVQCVCLLVSLVGSPFLVPYFQRTMGNGALGTCLTLVVSELVVVACGIVFATRGLFDATLLKSIAMALVAGAAMLGVALLLKPVSLFLAVPAACLVYAAVAWYGGAVQPSTADMIRDKLGRVLGKLRR
jgi:O-antigen/teichoic acid export membrane protein